MKGWLMFRVVAPLAIRLGLNLNRVFFPKLARERGEPWTMRSLRSEARRHQIIGNSLGDAMVDRKTPKREFPS
jgi:hypothetical protein